MNATKTEYVVSRNFSGERKTIEATRRLEAARIFLADDRIHRVEPRGRNASLCDAYRRDEFSENGQGEAHVGTIYFHG